MIMFLQIVVSVILFANKVFLVAGKKFGWLIGIVGCAIALLYFYLIHLYIFTVLEVGLIALMSYAYFTGKEKNPKTENMIRAISIGVMVFLCFFVFNGLLTVCEFGSSALFLIGTYLLSHNRANAGWILYCFAHALSAYVGYEKHQTFFADIQIASIVVSIAGMNFSKK